MRKADSNFPQFSDKVDLENMKTLAHPSTFQVNIGKICNLACKHCHIQAGPGRSEVMGEDVKEACLEVVKKYPFKIMDITGGAPEMLVGFEDFVKRARDHVSVTVRTNLVILEEEGYGHLYSFYADNGIDLVASLPSTGQRITDRQRGRGVFEKSIEALKKLNKVGYGKGDLKLDLVFNPNGAVLPPNQESLERSYRKDLYDNYGIVFDNLLAFTNVPIGRFGKFLERADMLDDYLKDLVTAFNPATLPYLMCKDILSVGWDGRIYDCDFNQAAGLGVLGPVKTIFDVVEKGTPVRRIRTGSHCYACTAGAGSS